MARYARSPPQGTIQPVPENNDDTVSVSGDETIVCDRRLIEELARRTRNYAAYISVIAGPNIGEMHKLRGDDVVGRDPEVLVSVADKEVSRQHVRFEKRGDGFFVRDLGSTNGTYLNGTSVTDAPLTDGDRIELGPRTVLKFGYQDDVDAEFQRRMYLAAVRDELTGAFNRKHFLERLETELAFGKRHDTSVVLVLFDVDDFKATNDTWGHLAGDYVLTTLARQVQKIIRREDILGRYGGDEFAMLSRGIDLEKGRLFAERVRQEIERLALSWEAQQISVTLSLGVAASMSAELEGWEELLGMADAALYAAKRGGRNRVEVQKAR